MNEPVRVLHVIGVMNQGGAETLIMNFYRNIDRSKIQFDFVENENEGAFFDKEIISLGGKIYHCPRLNGKNFFSYRRWWKAFFDEHKEHKIVHGHIGSTAAFYLKEAKNHGITTIAHSHNTDAGNLKQFFYNIISYPTRYIADYLFVCSRQAGIDRYGEAAVKQKGHLLANAINTESFRFNESTRQKKRNELGVASVTLLVGHIGRFADQKNHAYLIDVFKEIVSLFPNSRLLLVGDGELRKDIEEKIGVLGLQDKAVLLGLRSDVNELLAAMDVLVFPSKYEGLPVTLVEAQCSGLPCVISKNVPSDSILVEGLVHTLPLEDSPAVWAKTALNCKCEDRASYAEKVKEAGYDVVENAKWLEEFYLENAR